ncbi:MAG: hypothetical protein KDA66_02785 [Planctomycetaceae bacterium]|nr:hypothetical protein [Planctomycetaceae bacterium]
MIPFPQRPPSTTWEQVALTGTNALIWAWFKPMQGPTDVYVQIPPETLQHAGPALTLRNVMFSIGVTPEQIQSWAINGVPVLNSPQAVPYLDQPIPATTSPVIIRTLFAAQAPVPVPQMPVATPASEPSKYDGDSERIYQHIDSDWQTVLQIETNMGQLRKQLNALGGRLKSLNRDLNTNEAMAADSQEKREWQDIRRWLRDASAGVSRSIREFDVGDFSAAGGRSRFEELHRNYIQPRKPLPNLTQVAAEFEMYRKLAQNQFQKMQTASTAGARDGEQRASQFLSRIAAKIRNARHKR